jgi:hypothetical protein
MQVLIVNHNCNATFWVFSVVVFHKFESWSLKGTAVVQGIQGLDVSG